MNRREALRRLAVLFGGVAVAPEILANALANPSAILATVPADRLAVLAEMADTILPDTDSPGAKAANVQEFIVLAVETILSIGQRKHFWDGLTLAEESCFRNFSKPFEACSPQERIDFFKKMEADERNSPIADDSPFFSTLKSLTLFGYFSSEIGATQALNYDPVPGEWISDLKIDEHTKAWASIF